MKPILEYQDYRALIQDYYDEMKSRNLLSWRIFAKQAGFSSPSYLKLVCQGKANLSSAGIEQVGGAIGLQGIEMEYFRILVNLNQAKLASEKKLYLSQMEKFAHEHQIEILGDPMFTYFTSWLNPVMRELAPDISSTKPSEIARRFIFPVDINEIKNSLQFLVKNGFLTKTSDGHYEQAEKVVSSRSKDVASAALRELHRQIGTLALESLDTIPINERNFSELILGISKDGYEKIVQELADFRKKILDIAVQDQGLERVYSFNFQLFPLTRKNTSNPKKKSRKKTGPNSHSQASQPSDEK